MNIEIGGWKEKQSTLAQKTIGSLLEIEIKRLMFCSSNQLRGKNFFCINQQYFLK